MYLLGSKKFEVFVRLIVCLLGFLLSAYSLEVKRMKSLNEDYSAFCDINEQISCSAVFNSKWGKGFGVMHLFVGEESVLNQSNSVYGMLYFLLQFIGCFCENHIVSKVLLYTTGFGILSCIYLAYILAFILNDFCVVCVSTYVCTGILHFLNYKSYKRTSQSKLKKQ